MTSVSEVILPLVKSPDKDIAEYVASVMEGLVEENAPKRPDFDELVEAVEEILTSAEVMDAAAVPDWVRSVLTALTDAGLVEGEGNAPAEKYQDIGSNGTLLSAPVSLADLDAAGEAAGAAVMAVRVGNDASEDASYMSRGLDGLDPRAALMASTSDDRVAPALVSGRVSNLAKKAKRDEKKGLKAAPAAAVEDGEYAAVVTLKGGGAGGAAATSGEWESHVLVRVKGFDVTISGRPLMENAELIITAGHRYGLVGRNGQGKSTLLKAIDLGEIPVNSKARVMYVAQEAVGESTTTAVQAVLAADERREALLKREKDLNAALQDSKGADANLGLQSELEEVYEDLEAIGSNSAPARARSLLAGLQFTTEMMDGPTSELSGGWRMRVALAGALFAKPDLLMLDEPTNHLDLNAVIFLQDLLAEWQGTLVVVSHDRHFLNAICTDIVSLKAGQLTTWKGNYDTYEQAALMAAAAHAKAVESAENRRKHVQKFIDRFRFNAKRASLVQSRIKALSKMPILANMEEDGEISFDFVAPDKLPPPVLQFSDVSFGWPGAPKLFGGLNVGLDMDSRVALVGVNGCGKSSLMKLLMDEVSPASGRVQRNPRLRLAMFTQHFVDGLDLSVNPLELLIRMAPNVDPQNLRAHLGRFGLSGPLALQTISTLSGGQKARVGLAVLAYQKPHILLLDEPSNHLDMEAIDALAAALTVFEGGVILVSHDQRLIELVADEIWEIANKKVTEWKGDFAAYRKKLEKEAKKAAATGTRVSS